MASTPASIMPMATTQAKTGRSIKKRAMIFLLLCLDRRRGCAGGLTLFCGCGELDDPDGSARANLLNAFDNQAVSRRQAFADQPLIRDRPVQHDRALLD